MASTRARDKWEGLEQQWPCLGFRGLAAPLGNSVITKANSWPTQPHHGAALACSPPLAATPPRGPPPIATRQGTHLTTGTMSVLLSSAANAAYLRRQRRLLLVRPYAHSASRYRRGLGSQGKTRGAGGKSVAAMGSGSPVLAFTLQMDWAEDTADSRPVNSSGIHALSPSAVRLLAEPAPKSELCFWTEGEPGESLSL